MRPEQRDKFDGFVAQMYNELCTNAPKGDFTAYPVEVGLREVDDHLAKLKAALAAGEKVNLNRVRELCADLANCALIVACGAGAVNGSVVHSMPPVNRESQWWSPG